MEKILRKILRVPLESPAPDPVFDPDLDLQFARDLALDHRITFTRASTATFVGSNKLIQSASNNVARFDHDPATGESLGLLIEEARTNDIRASEDFTAGTWSVFGGMTVSANQTTAPDGTTTADKLIEHSSGSDGPRIVDFISHAPLSTDTSCVFSCFLKNNDARYVGLAVRSSGSSNFNAEFDLQEGVVVSSGKHGNSTFTSVEMKSYGNGWYRCVIIGKTDTSSVASDMLIVSITDGSGVNATGFGDNFTGDGSSIFAWGAQFAEATFETSYIPTSGSAVTRAVDVADIDTTDFPFNFTEFSWFVEAQTAKIATDLTHIFRGGAATSERVLIQFDASHTVRALVRHNGVNKFDQSLGSPQTATAFVKVALGVKSNDTFFVLDGDTSVSDTTVDMPDTIPDIAIGSTASSSGSNSLNGHIRTLQYFARRLDDATLTALTQPSLEPSLSLVFDSSETSFVDTELTR